MARSVLSPQLLPVIICLAGAPSALGFAPSGGLLGSVSGAGLMGSVGSASQDDHVAILFTGDLFWALGPAVGVYKKTEFTNDITKTAIWERDLEKSGQYGTGTFWLAQCKYKSRYYWALTQTRDKALAVDTCDRSLVAFFWTGIVGKNENSKNDPPYGEEVKHLAYRAGHFDKMSTNTLKVAGSSTLKMASIERSVCAPCNAFQLELKGNAATYQKNVIGVYNLQKGQFREKNFYKQEPTGAKGERTRYLSFCDRSQYWIVGSEVGKCTAYVHSDKATSKAQEVCPTGTDWKRYSDRDKKWQSSKYMSLTCSAPKGGDCGRILLQITSEAAQKYAQMGKEVEFTFVGIDDGKYKSSKSSHDELSSVPLKGYPVYKGLSDNKATYYMRACHYGSHYLWMVHKEKDTVCTHGQFRTHRGNDNKSPDKLMSPVKQGGFYFKRGFHHEWKNIKEAKMTCVPDL